MVDLDLVSRSWQGQMWKQKMLNNSLNISFREKVVRIKVVENFMPDMIMKSNFVRQVALRSSPGVEMTYRHFFIIFDIFGYKIVNNSPIFVKQSAKWWKWQVLSNYVSVVAIDCHFFEWRHDKHGFFSIFGKDA